VRRPLPLLRPAEKVGTVESVAARCPMRTIRHPVKDGDILLAPSWMLTTAHPASSSGRPVLVNRATGRAFGPDDVVAPGGTNHQPARMFVTRLAKTLPDGQRRVAANW